MGERKERTPRIRRRLNANFHRDYTTLCKREILRGDYIWYNITWNKVQFSSVVPTTSGRRKFIFSPSLEPARELLRGELIDEKLDAGF